MAFLKGDFMSGLVVVLEQVRAEMPGYTEEAREAAKHLEASIWWLSELERKQCAMGILLD